MHFDFRRKTIQLEFVDIQIFFPSKPSVFHSYWILCCFDFIVLVIAYQLSAKYLKATFISWVLRLFKHKDTSMDTKFRLTIAQTALSRISIITVFSHFQTSRAHENRHPALIFYQFFKVICH